MTDHTDQLEIVFDRFHEGRLDAHATRRLKEALAHDPEARRAFAAHARSCALLAVACRQRSAVASAPEPQPNAQVRSRKLVMFTTLAAAAAAVLLLGAGVIYSDPVVESAPQLNVAPVVNVDSSADADNKVMVVRLDRTTPVNYRIDLASRRVVTVTVQRDRQ